MRTAQNGWTHSSLRMPRIVDAASGSLHSRECGLERRRHRLINGDKERVFLTSEAGVRSRTGYRRKSAKTADLSTMLPRPLCYPEFPVGFGGVEQVDAPFFSERRIRSSF